MNFNPFFQMPHNNIDNKTLYKELNIEQNASDSDIKKAFHKLAIKQHPDKGGNAEQFKKINNAYNILKDPEKRKIYDLHGIEGLEHHLSSNMYKKKKTKPILIWNYDTSISEDINSKVTPYIFCNHSNKCYI